jgi:hypothetical protein
MSDQIILKINKLLNETGYKSQITGLSDLEAFLCDPRSKSLGVYDEVEELYDVLMLGSGMW